MNEAMLNTAIPNIADMTPANVSFNGSLTGKDRAELKKAAQEFEAVFIRQLLKVMRETIEESSSEGSGLGKGVYTELFDQEIAISMSQRGALGIGDIIYRSLVENEAKENPVGQEIDQESAGDVRNVNVGNAGIRNADTLKNSDVASSSISHSHAHETAPTDHHDHSDHAEPEDSHEISGQMKPADITDMLLPVNAPISSNYGMRKDPFTGRIRFHKGVDIAAPSGTPVVAALPGKVISVGHEGGYGKTVLVEHDNGLRTRYGHLASINVRVGDMVTSEDTLGTVGNTGRATGAHLHFEVTRMGQPINPLLSSK